MQLHPYYVGTTITPVIYNFTAHQFQEEFIKTCSCSYKMLIVTAE